MAKLRDVFPKWALRERSYGELDVGPHVFEVTDFLIPAGTDWANLSRAHLVGVPVVAPVPVGGLLASVYLELDKPSAAVNDGVTMQLRGGDDDAGMLGATVDQVGDIWASDTQILDFQVYANYPRSGPPASAPLELAAYLFTDGPTSVDYTVVRARAAFMVL